jgi:hypothetical protein
VLIKTRASRLLTNQVRSVSIKYFKKNLHLFRGGPGYLRWRNSTKMDSISFSVCMTDENEHIRLRYDRKDAFSKETHSLDYSVQLNWTPCFYGGFRWWFLCPLKNNGEICNRRSGVLYLGGPYFGCRLCYNLVYESTRDSHRFDKLYRHMYKKMQATQKGPKIVNKNRNV